MRIIGAALLVALLAGCGALRLVYKQADELMYWWADGYADFTDAQAPRVRAAIGDWLAWHRRTQLPLYATRLQQLQPQLAADTTPATLCALQDDLRHWFDTAFAQGLPPLAALAPTLEPAQLQSMEKRFGKANREFRRDFVQPDAEGRREAQLKRTLERAERLYGRFDRSQRERIAQWVAQSPFDPERSLQRRQAHQQDVLHTLRGLAGAPAAQAQPALQALARRIAHPEQPEEQHYQQALDAHNCRLAADIHNLATPEQRRTARERLHGWEVDLRTLSAPPKG